MSRVMINEGVVGGFAPAVLKRSCIIDVEKDNSVEITHNIKQSNDRHLSDYVESKKAFKNPEISDFINNVFIPTFKKLPREDPPGCEDVYKMDTSVSIDAEDRFRWENMPNQGCTTQPSRTLPSKEQVAKFKEMVEKLWILTEKHAKK